MIVSVQLCPGFTNNHFKMKEVETEEEAFYEMRRYLEVNNIYSDVTTLGKKRDDEYVGTRGVYRYVFMDAPLGETITFAIHYTSRPDYDSIGDALSREQGMFRYYYPQYLRKKNGEVVYDRLHLHVGRQSSADEDSRFWSWLPDEYENYMKDLKKRVGEVCH